MQAKKSDRIGKSVSDYKIYAQFLPEFQQKGKNNEKRKYWNFYSDDGKDRGLADLERRVLPLIMERTSLIILSKREGDKWRELKRWQYGSLSNTGSTRFKIWIRTTVQFSAQMVNMGLSRNGNITRSGDGSDQERKLTDATDAYFYNFRQMLKSPNLQGKWVKAVIYEQLEDGKSQAVASITPAGVYAFQDKLLEQELKVSKNYSAPQLGLVLTYQ